MPKMHLHHSHTSPPSLGPDDSRSFPNSMTSSYVPPTLHHTPTQHKSAKIKTSIPKTKTGTIGALIMNIALPTDSGKEGKKKQTDTIEALMANIKAYDETMARPKVDSKRKRMLEEMMMERLGGLKKMGIFDLFSPDDWIKGPSAGRKFIGELAKKETYSNL